MYIVPYNYYPTLYLKVCYKLIRTRKSTLNFYRDFYSIDCRFYAIVEHKPLLYYITYSINFTPKYIYIYIIIQIPVRKVIFSFPIYKRF